MARDAGRELLTSSRDPKPDRAALIGRLSLRDDGEWLTELLIDLEEDEMARMHLVDALQRLEA